MFSGRSWDEWIARYESSHRDPRNRWCHTFGIPLVAAGATMLLVSIFLHSLLPFAAAIFATGWILQFLGHWFEGKKPEFFSDWRFLFVGLRWWVIKVAGTRH